MSLPYYYIMGKGGSEPPASITESIHFNGANGVSQANHNFGILGTFPVTITFWWKRDTVPDVFNVVLGQWSAAGFVRGVTVRISSTEIEGMYGDGVNFRRHGMTFAGVGVTDVFDWNFYAVEFTSLLNVKMRANLGTKVEAPFVGGSTPSMVVSGYTSIGATPHAGQYSRHHVYDLRSYNSILTEGQLTDGYNGELLGTEAAIAGNATGTTWEDLTGNGYDTTLSGSFAISTDIPT